ncbi:hypothetical protein B0J13DRAFT_522230 [Dactylonectria estremocensis]|uniref:Uncharacterized protein n=1 Tax=Dactylonectria estremocensis TaxID=1079267 RepID=A0A9P9F2E9_9HYPO|nr:hypothetical protein B0J13DRAFT_522230 [Dactylonectria estremocensis]
MGSSTSGADFIACLRQLFAEAAAKKRTTKRDEFASLRGPLVKFVFECGTTLRVAQARSNCTLQLSDGKLPKTDLQLPKMKVDAQTRDKLNTASSGSEFIQILQAKIEKQVPQRRKIHIITKTRQEAQMAKTRTEIEPKVEPKAEPKIGPDIKPNAEQIEPKIDLTTLKRIELETTLNEAQPEVPTETPETIQSEEPILTLEERIIDGMATEGDAEWASYKKSLALALSEPLVDSRSVAQRIMPTFKFLRNKSVFAEPAD